MDISHVTREGTVIPVRIDPAGLRGPTRHQSRGTEWRRSGVGLYVPAYVDPEPPWQRIVEAAADYPGARGVTGWASLSWQGSRWFSGLAGDGRTPRPVPIALGHDRVSRPRPGILLSEEWLDDSDITEIDGLAVTVPARSVCFEMRRSRSLAEAATIASIAAFSDHTSLEEIHDYARTMLDGRPWTSRIHRALPHSVENAWSPREISMLITWTVEGGYPRPLCNAPIFDRNGSHLFTPDLFDPENGVVGEYDSLIHLEDRRRGRDMDREELVRDIGLELVTMVTADNSDHTSFLRRLSSAYARARTRRRTNSWTLTQPEWWIDTSTVEKRRALSAVERDTWLRRQAA